MSTTRMKAKAQLAIGVLIAACLAILPSSAAAAKSRRYVLKHATEHCRKNYVKKTEVRRRRHGKKVKVAVCVRAPKAAASIAPTTPPIAPATTPGPTSTVTSLSIKRVPKELLGIELGKDGCWNIASAKEDLAILSALEKVEGSGLEGPALEEQLEALKKAEEALEKELKGITADLCFYEVEPQVKTPAGAQIGGATTLDFTNPLEPGRQWILPGGSRLPLVEFTVSIDEHTVTALVSFELGTLVTEFVEKLEITKLETELVEQQKKFSEEGEGALPEGGLALEASKLVDAIPAIPVIGVSDGTGPFSGSGGWTVGAKYAGSTEFAASESAPTPVG